MRILLCCGAGWSSSFLVQKMRKAIKTNKLESVYCEAVPFSTIGEVCEDFDIVCLGPHYRDELEEVAEKCVKYGTKAIVIPDNIYGMLDAEALLNLCKEKVEQ